jgi:F0F1-type ATP synthase assembly protein I
MAKKSRKPNPWLYFTAIGFQMAVVIAGSVFLGIWLDKTYTDSSKIFTIILSLLGIFVALTQVIVSLKNFKE